MEHIWQALATIIDPELKYSIVDLGLVYDVQALTEGVVVTMTLTSPTCPLREHFRTAITAKLQQLLGPIPVTVTFTLSPRWSLQQATPAVREELALLGIGSVQW